MSTNLQVVNPLEIDEWDELIANTAGSSFFHTRAWLETLVNTYHYDPCFIIEENNNKLGQLIPLLEVNSWISGKRGVSLPFTDKCDLILNDCDIDKTFNFILNLGKGKNWKTIEFRDDSCFKSDLPFSAKFYEHTLYFGEDPEKIFNAFRSSTKRNIKRAIKENLNVNIDNSPAAMKEYYRLHCITRRRQDVPPQPYSFFKNIYSFVISKKHGNIFLTEFDNKNIAGMVFFHHNSEAIYKFGGSDKRYQALRPNNLLMWKAISYYLNKDYKSLNFGRTDKSNTGLRQFKRGFNPLEIEKRYYKYDFQKNVYLNERNKASGIREKIFSYMPGFALKLVGRIAYKHIG